LRFAVAAADLTRLHRLLLTFDDDAGCWVQRVVNGLQGREAFDLGSEVFEVSRKVTNIAMLSHPGLSLVGGEFVTGLEQYQLSLSDAEQFEQDFRLASAIRLDRVIRGHNVDRIVRQRNGREFRAEGFSGRSVPRRILAAENPGGAR
jgi:hypothetical protein